MEKIMHDRISNHRKILAFLLSTILIYIFLFICNVREYLYDADTYWTISKSLWSDGRLIFKPELFNIRGYTWPLLLAILNGFGNLNVYIFWINIAMLYSLLGAIVMFDMFENVFNIQISCIKRVLTILLVVVFWPGVVCYPLSDLIAILISIFSLYFLVLLNKNEDGAIKTLLFVFLSGFLADSALNIRATYKYTLYVGLLGIVVIYVKKKKFNYMMIAILGYFLGVFVAAAPQIYANNINYGVWGIDNPLSYWNNGNRAVFLLYEGAAWSRYETYIGSTPGISVAYIGIDPTTLSIFEKEGIELYMAEQFSLVDFIKLVVKYPVEFVTIYFSHIVNCLDVRYGELYVKEFGGIKRYIIYALSIFIYTAIFIDFHTRMGNKINSLKGIKQICSSQWFWVSLYILVPAIISLPGHIEPRYAMAAHILMYIYFVCKLDYGGLFKWIKNHVVLALLIYCALFATIALVCNWSLASASDVNILF